MRAGKRIFCIITLLIALLLDVSIIPFTGLNMAYCPRLSLLVVITIAIIEGRTRGITFGVFAGLLLGFTVYTPTAVTAIIYTLTGFTAGFLGRKVSSTMITVIPVVIALALYEGVMAFAYYFTANSINNALIMYALARVLIGTLVLQVVFLPVVYVLEPARLGIRHR